MHVKLKVLRGASAGKEVTVRGPKFLIGRSEECQLRANSDAISRRHCAITVGETEAKIRDLGSRNGTFVNGTRVEGDHRIQIGDQLRVGPLEFLVTHVQGSPVPKAASVRSGGAPEDDMAGLISDWLNEADEEDRRTRVDERGTEMETRAFRMEETDRIQLNKTKDSGGNSATADKRSGDGATGNAQAAGNGNAPEPNSHPEAPSSSEPERNDARDRSTPGSFTRHASPKNVAPKDTQEAAAQTLRKFFNRGG